MSTPNTDILDENAAMIKDIHRGVQQINKRNNP